MWPLTFKTVPFHYILMGCLIHDFKYRLLLPLLFLIVVDRKYIFLICYHHRTSFGSMCYQFLLLIGLTGLLVNNNWWSCLYLMDWVSSSTFLLIINDRNCYSVKTKWLVSSWHVTLPWCMASLVKIKLYRINDLHSLSSKLQGEHKGYRVQLGYL